MTKAPTPAWILVLDRDRARLLRGSRTSHGSVHLDEVGKLASTWMGGEHHRPTQLAPGRSAGEGHEREEQLRHFAREVAAWLPRELTAHGAEHCTAFAPTHMIGALKPELPTALTARVVMHAGELAQLPLGELAKHPRVVEAMGT